MSVALQTSNTASMQCMCVSPDTPDFRGRADVDRAQDLDGAVCAQRMCVRRYTWFGLSIALKTSTALSACSVCAVSYTHLRAHET